MCTVTFIARRHGYAIGMNRDESVARVTGLPPRPVQSRGRTILAPQEPAGGTWIGVNDTGAGLALINWYAIPSRIVRRALSRGEVVRKALPSDSPEEVEATLRSQPLARANPFRLIGVFPSSRSVVEWRWNLQFLESRVHEWRTSIWISSGFDERGAQRERSRTFNEALRQRSAESTAWLRRLHQSHTPQCGPYSTCMHREGAKTVSYCEITVTHRMAQMRYAAGTPCCTALSIAIKLPLKR